MNKPTRTSRIFGLLAALMFSGSVFAADITGAGATFPYPIYAKWAEAYKAKSNIGLNYQSIGSGGGIKQINAKTVDFGASDKPLTPEELAKGNLTQFPTVVGGVVPVVNIDGIAAGQLKLDGATLAAIYLGKITKWNDPAIVALNSGVKLPDEEITAVYRSDGSGTTFIFTNYLAKASADWKSTVGEGTAVSWKMPSGAGGKGNEGVSSYVKRLKNSIGYVEYAYALQNKMAYVQMKNRDGNFVTPNAESFKAAAAGADWAKAPGFYEILTDEPGKNAWPIAGATFILMQMSQDKPAVGAEVLKFFDWAYKDGGKMAESLDYIPMPESVVKLIRASWAANIKGADGKAIWK
jgi:phosphate transport system substrate-binding protein